MANISWVANFLSLPATHQLPNHCSLSPFLQIQPHKSNLPISCTKLQIEEKINVSNVSEDNGFSPSRMDTFTFNKYLSSFVKSGRLQDAHDLFDRMPERNEVSWSTIISAYSRSGNYLKAFDLLEKMGKEGLRPNEFALGSLIKASSGLRDICIGKQLHGWSITTGFGLDPVVQTSLVTMYSSCGCLSDSRKVFNGSPGSSKHDVPLWNSIIAAYVLHDSWIEAIELFTRMISMELVSPTKFTYASVISACSNEREDKYGKIIHGMVIKDGIVNETMMGNSLVTFYGKCGILEDANAVFERISTKSVVSWNAIIAGNEQNGEENTAIGYFRRMVREGNSVKPNRITFLSVLTAVSKVSALKHGKEIHCCLIKSGLELETTIANCLITMYSKCKEVGKASLVFKSFPFKDMVTWNSMLTGFEQNEEWDKCLQLFRNMVVLGIRPDDHSFTVILGAASSLPFDFKYLQMGRVVHGYILRRAASAGVATSSSNAILTMYAKTNRIEDAEKIFRGMSEKDSYSWNAMIDGYSMNGRFEDSIKIFLEKHEHKFPSDHWTFSILLTACSRLVSLNLGKQFHAFTIKNNDRRCHTNPNHLLSINNSLISMYSKCGSISDATQIFSRMRKKDVFSWTSMITGYAHHGMAYESFKLLDRMKLDGIKPNSITFLGLLTACAHTRLVKEGLHYFNSMNQEHDLKPSSEHYACMVDLFGRAGHLEKAMEFVESGSTSFTPLNNEFLMLWKVFLGACHAHKDLHLGITAATKILEFDPEDETTHILLSNLYASKGMWEEAIRVRKSLKDKGLKKKEIGCSWIEAEKRKHLFVAGDVSHPRRKEIYMKLEEVNGRCRKMGYSPMTEFVLHDVDEFQKEAIVGCHSEKLAVSFGLLQNGNNGVIRVIKNLRVCGDCHNWMKFASIIEKRKIVLRDSRRFHFFENGECSCRDYW